MKLVYSHHNSLLVGNARNILAEAGIDVEVKNDILAGASGELSPIDSWPEVWVVRDSDEPRALSLLQPLTDKHPLSHWLCPVCGESNASSFASCWQCQASAPESASATGGQTDEQ